MLPRLGHLYECSLLIACIMCSSAQERSQSSAQATRLLTGARIRSVGPSDRLGPALAASGGSRRRSRASVHVHSATARLYCSRVRRRGPHASVLCTRTGPMDQGACDRTRGTRASPAARRADA